MTQGRELAIELFAGVGGFAHSLLDAFDIALAVEIDPTAQARYLAEFPEHPADRLVSDIRTLTWRAADGSLLDAHTLAAHAAAARTGRSWNGPELVAATQEQVQQALRDRGVDLERVGAVVGGFPCQPFSKSGAQDGVADAIRGTLFADTLAIVQACPNVHTVILENVENLAGPRHRETFATIIAALRELGFAIADEPTKLSPHLLAPEHGGQPQSRQRVWFLASKVSGAGGAAPTAEQLRAPRAGVAELVAALGWDKHAWDVTELCDPDDSFDTRPFLLSARDSVYISAWDDLVQSLPLEVLPGELHVDSWVDRWEPPAGKAAEQYGRMRRSHGLFVGLDFSRKDEHGDPVPFEPQLAGALRRAIRAWLATGYDIDGQRVTPRQFPASRRILEWQASEAKIAPANRCLWDMAIQLRPSGVRVKPLTYLPALVAIGSQNSIIGPRRRYVTPREAGRLQGFPVGVWSPALDDQPRPAGSGQRSTKTTSQRSSKAASKRNIETSKSSSMSRAVLPEEGAAPGLQRRLEVLAGRLAEAGVQAMPVRMTVPDELERAAGELADAWFTRGGPHEQALELAATASDGCGAGAGEVVLAAAALVLRQRRWRGSGLRWSSLAWDTYTGAVATADPVAFDPSLAAIDFRVRQRLAVTFGRTVAASSPAGPAAVIVGEQAGSQETGTADGPGGAGGEVSAQEAAQAFARTASVALPTADTGGWAGRALAIGEAVLAGLPVVWLRALHRSALLARWDDRQFRLQGLVELDEALMRLGLITPYSLTAHAPTPSMMRAALIASKDRTAKVLGVAAHRVPSRYAGCGPVLLPASVTGSAFTAGVERVNTARDVWEAARRRKLAAGGDVRAEQAEVGAQEQWLEAVLGLRRHRSARPLLWQAYRTGSALARSAGRVAVAGSVFGNGQARATRLADAAVAALDCWAGGLVSAPYGPPDRLVDPGLVGSAARDNLQVAVQWLTAHEQSPPSVGEVDEGRWALERANRQLVVLDARLMAAGEPVSVRSAVMRAHYERRREMLAHVLGLALAGVVDAQQADGLCLGLLRRASVTDLVDELSLAVEFVEAEQADPSDPVPAALAAFGAVAPQIDAGGHVLDGGVLQQHRGQSDQPERAGAGRAMVYRQAAGRVDDQAGTVRIG